MTDRRALTFPRHAWLLGLIFTSAFAGAANYDIPKVTGITVDGALEDWGAAGLAVEVLTDKDGRAELPGDFDPRFRLSWDETGLALALTVQDDLLSEQVDPAALWDGDSIEWFILSGADAAAMLHVAVSPGLADGQPELRSNVYGLHQTPYARTAALELARVHTETGYQLEARVPWNALVAPPAPGGEIGVQLYFNDVDHPPARFQATWFPQTRTHEHADRVHRLRLAEQSSPAIRLRTQHSFDAFGRVAIDVNAIAGWTGEVLTARRNDHVTTTTLAPQGGRAAGRLILPMPVRGAGVSQVDLLRAGHIVETLHFPDADEARARRVMTASIGPSRYVIQDAALPPCDFENPLLGQQLLGPYRVETTYYDAGMNVVTSADAPGRYGAVIRILPETGAPVVRYRTVARLPEGYSGYNPWVQRPEASLLLPVSLGVDAGALAAQAAPFARYLANGFFQSFADTPGAAPLLLGLYESPVRGRAALVTEWPETLDRQWWVKMKRVLYYSKKKMDRQFNAPLRNAGEDYPVIRVGTPKEAGVKSDAAEKIDAVLQAWSAASGEPFAAAVARKGVVYFQGAYGERDGVPMTMDTPSWMASITKPMSGTLMMMLVDQGLVGLDDPVGPYLPALDYIDVPEPLTVRRLYTHMNGLQLDLQVPGFHADHWGDEMNDLEEIIAGYYPHLAIGKTQGYNGVGYALGGKIIEMISGEAIPVFFKNHLLDPLEMTNTTVTDTSARAFSTPMDMARFGQMLLNRGGYGGYHFFSPETFEAMLPRPLSEDFGFEGDQAWGIGVLPMPQPGLSDKTFGHGAASAATLLIDPEHELVIVMTRNQAGPEFSTWHPKFIQAVVDGLATEQ
jgi:CubicO group peptidase (beta-lactamase class C family)